jgi:hypothetical protein
MTRVAARDKAYLQGEVYAVDPIGRLRSLKSCTDTVTRFPDHIIGINPTVARKSSFSTIEPAGIVKACFLSGSNATKGFVSWYATHILAKQVLCHGQQRAQR